MKNFSLILTVFFVLTLLPSCEKEEKEPVGGNKIVVGSTTSLVIFSNSAKVSSGLESIKGNKVIEYGHCWGTNPDPVIGGSRTTLGQPSEAKSFSSQLDQLLPNTSYYIRAYATTDYETIYGKETTIKTLDYANPTVTTTEVTGTTAYSIRTGGNVTADGGFPVTARGVVWSTSVPTVNENIGITIDGSGTGSFISQINNLQPATTYYVRAYATNNKGTDYGIQISFITRAAPTLASLTTSSPTDITHNSATLGGTITNDGNTDIIERGVCYGTSQNPTTANSKTNNGTGVGSFTSYLTGLSDNITYYLRAYAINSQGTAYGNEVSLKTLEKPVADIDGNIYHTVTIGTQVWMVENLKTTKYKDGTSIPIVTMNSQWAGLTTGAYCWYNNAVLNKNTYGALYNWYAVNTGKLAPIGWHVATNAEWTNLINYLGGLNVAGGKLKEIGTTHWISPNTNATNSVGFIALPSGYRYDDGTFKGIGEDGSWWSSTIYGTNSAFDYSISYNNNNIVYYNDYMEFGFAVRCVKDY